MKDGNEHNSLGQIVTALEDLSVKAKAADHLLLGYLIDIAREEAGDTARSGADERSAEIVPFRIAAQLRARSGTSR